MSPQSSPFFSSPHLAHTFSLKNASLFTGQPWCIFPNTRPSTIIPSSPPSCWWLFWVHRSWEVPQNPLRGWSHHLSCCWGWGNPWEKSVLELTIGRLPVFFKGCHGNKTAFVKGEVCFFLKYGWCVYVSSMYFWGLVDPHMYCKKYDLLEWTNCDTQPTNLD